MAEKGTLRSLIPQKFLNNIFKKQNKKTNHINFFFFFTQYIVFYCFYCFNMLAVFQQISPERIIKILLHCRGLRMKNKENAKTKKEKK